MVVCDGVDVCLLVFGSSDILMVVGLLCFGYWLLFKVGVCVFEWNGLMIYVKMVVVDGIWVCVGLFNFNVVSWLGNCEIDVVVED